MRCKSVGRVAAESANFQRAVTCFAATNQVFCAFLRQTSTTTHNRHLVSLPGGLRRFSKTYCSPTATLVVPEHFVEIQTTCKSALVTFHNSRAVCSFARNYYFRKPVIQTEHSAPKPKACHQGRHLTLLYILRWYRNAGSRYTLQTHAQQRPFEQESGSSHRPNSERR